MRQLRAVRYGPIFALRSAISSGLWLGLGSVLGRMCARQTVTDVFGKDFGIAFRAPSAKLSFTLIVRARLCRGAAGEGNSNSPQVSD
jgi:hypothetical protein